MAYLQSVCKIGQREACCRYIVAGSDGITCAKLTPMKDSIDNRASRMTAQADNCKGVDGTLRLDKIEDPKRMSHHLLSQNGIEVRKTHTFMLPPSQVYVPPYKLSWAERRRNEIVWRELERISKMRVFAVVMLRLVFLLVGLLIGGLLMYVEVINGIHGPVLGFFDAMVTIAFWVFSWGTVDGIETNPNYIQFKRRKRHG